MMTPWNVVVVSFHFLLKWRRNGSDLRATTLIPSTKKVYLFFFSTLKSIKSYVFLTLCFSPLSHRDLCEVLARCLHAGYDDSFQNKQSFKGTSPSCCVITVQETLSPLSPPSLLPSLLPPPPQTLDSETPLPSAPKNPDPFVFNYIYFNYILMYSYNCIYMYIYLYIHVLFCPPLHRFRDSFSPFAIRLLNTHTYK